MRFFIDTFTQKTPHIFLFGLLIFLFGQCTSGEDKQTTTTDSLQNVTKNTSDSRKTDTVAVKNVSKLMTVVQKTEEENNRFVDLNGILNIDFLESGVAASKQKEVIEKLFPNAQISPLDESDQFDVFNIVYKGETYNAIVISENEKHGKMLAYIYIAEGEFSMEILSKIL